MSRYEEAKKMYAAYGVDTEEALCRLKEIPVSVHCWQGDDVLGFDGSDSLSGGIQTTGNYPGKAVGPEQLMADIKKASESACKLCRSRRGQRQGGQRRLYV